MSIVERENVDPWIQTYSGERFELLKPDLETIKIKDIAHSLSFLARFNGHVNYFYSVAEHSIMVSNLVPEKYALFGLLHDASEAYVGDMATPVKSLFPEFKQLSKNIEDVIFKKYRVNVTEDAIQAVKEADLISLKIEFNFLMKKANGSLDIPILNDVIIPSNINQNLYIRHRADVEGSFIKRFNELI